MKAVARKSTEKKSRNRNQRRREKKHAREKGFWGWALFGNAGPISAGDVDARGMTDAFRQAKTKLGNDLPSSQYRLRATCPAGEWNWDKTLVVTELNNGKAQEATPTQDES